MDRRFVLFSLSLSPLLALALFCTQAAANNEGDPVKGQEKSQLCQGCHGADGNSLSDEWPNLAQQHADYLSKQLHNFQSGARKDPTMTGMAATVSADDIKDITAYFSSQKINRAAIAKEEFDSQLLLVGKKIYKGGNLYSGVPACAGCHGPNGAGNAPGKFPRLDGQKITYVTKQLKDFAAATRSNDPRSIMQNVASRLSEKEIIAVATYIRALGAPMSVVQQDVAEAKKEVTKEQKDAEKK